MPYVKEYQREWAHQNLSSPGELNYAITMLIKTYVEKWRECYDTYNECLGVLNAVSQELYRRKIAPYEDKKMAENGDVW